MKKKSKLQYLKPAWTGDNCNRKETPDEYRGFATLFFCPICQEYYSDKKGFNLEYLFKYYITEGGNKNCNDCESRIL